MSVGIHFEHIVKKYGDNTIIPDLNLDVKEGEFFTLLGPSGCGKTTLLRMVAGFNSIEGGTIAFNGKVINDIAPNKRNIGMVFQNYAVFPHMTVRENVAFGLENRHLPKNEIKQRVDEILETVKITQYADRLPERLSGGQQQRVALARAIVIKPDVLLMDSRSPTWTRSCASRCATRFVRFRTASASPRFTLPTIRKKRWRFRTASRSCPAA